MMNLSSVRQGLGLVVVYAVILSIDWMEKVHVVGEQEDA